MVRNPRALPLIVLIAALTLPLASTTGSIQAPMNGPAAFSLANAADLLPQTGHPHQADQEQSEPGFTEGFTDAGGEPWPTVTVQLQAVKKMVNVLGVPTEAWTFNGAVPGPIIRITEGTKLEIVLTNALDQAHSIHTHLRGNLLASDGSSDTAPFPIVPHQHNPFPVEQNPIGPYEPREDRDVADPGGSYTYTYYADTPGTFPYHCHVFLATEHIGRGLFGLIVVYPEGWTWEELPKDDLNGNTKARVTDAQGNNYFEDVVVINEVTPANLPSPGVAVPGVPWYPSGVSTSGFTPPAVGKVNLANFRAWNDPYVVGPVRPNEKVLIRIANLGDELHDWHVHSTWFDVIDKISREKKVLYTADTLLLGPGDSAETVLTAGAPGYWFMHDHIVPDAYTGMVPWLWVEGDPLPNTPPTAFVDTPIDGAVVAGRVLFKGSADDFNGREMVRRVEIRVDEGSWEPVRGLLSWRYEWDSSLVADGAHVVTVRSFDGIGYSPEQALGVIVHNAGILDAGTASAAAGGSEQAASRGGASPGWGAMAGLGALAVVGILVARRRHG